MNMILLNMKGEEVKRTPFEYPYSYDPFVVWKGKYKKTDEIVYSDRLIEWDHEKFDKCCKAIWGNTIQSFDMRNPVTIEAFLSMYLEKIVTLTGIEKCCNVSNGYPIWIFYYRESELADDLHFDSEEESFSYTSSLIGNFYYQ